MAEPQPSTVHEGASTPPAPPAAAASAAAEAAALDSLDNKTLSDASSAPKKEIDLKALNDAMKALDSGAGGKKVSAAAAAAGGLKKDEEPAKLIKVDAADVTLLVSRRVVPPEMLGCSALMTVLLMVRVLGGAARSLTTESHRVVESARCRRHSGDEGLGFGNCLGNSLSRTYLDEAVAFLNAARPYGRNENDDVKVTYLLYCYTIFTLTAGPNQMLRIAKERKSL